MKIKDGDYIEIKESFWNNKTHGAVIEDHNGELFINEFGRLYPIKTKNFKIIGNKYLTKDEK